MGKVMLCADEMCLRNPSILGLEGENLLAQSWLQVASKAQDARRMVREAASLSEAWVVSCDDVEAINAAAALKKDRADMPVFLVSPKNSGSLVSRANAAGIDAVMGSGEFVSRYMAQKALASQGAPAGWSASSAHPIPIAANKGGSPVRQMASFAPSLQVAALAKPGREAYLLAVAGASGGCGKSAVSATMACAAAAVGCRTLLLDMDSQFGDGARLLGFKDYVTTDELLADASLAGRIPHIQGKPDVLAAPRFLEQEEAVLAGFRTILDRVRTSYDVIVANTGAHWSDVQMQLFECAGNVVFLIDQRPSSIHAAKHAMALCSRCGVATSPFVFALNRCGKGSVFTATDVACAMDGVSVWEIADGGMEVEEALCAGNPAALFSGNPFGASVAKLLFQYLPSMECMDGQKAQSLAEASRKRFSLRRKVG